MNNPHRDSRFARDGCLDKTAGMFAGQEDLMLIVFYLVFTDECEVDGYVVSIRHHKVHTLHTGRYRIIQDRPAGLIHGCLHRRADVGCECIQNVGKGNAGYCIERR